jgi:enolase-phosphatase E1
VYGTLFPYARHNLRRYLDAHDRSTEYERMRALMDQDSKDPELKELQGHIWEDGYTTGELVGRVFDDVRPALERWSSQAVAVGIFSSGSVLAQKLLFAHSNAGDLTPLLRWHFDTAVGRKTEPDSYLRIARAIGQAPTAILFVSDVVAELDAARTAGMQTALAIRPGNASQPAGHGHPPVTRFDELGLD